MSKKSFNEIEDTIRQVLEANEPAFKEEAWEKMEALLDKDKDRKKPFPFWLWLFLPLLIGIGIAGYYTFNTTNKINRKSNSTVTKTTGQTELQVGTKNDMPGKTSSGIVYSNNKNNTTQIPIGKQEEIGNEESLPKTFANKTTPYFIKKNKTTFLKDDSQASEELFEKNKNKRNLKGKVKATINNATAEEPQQVRASTIENESEYKNSVAKDSTGNKSLVVTIDSKNKSDKEIEKIVDSVVRKINVNKKKRNTFSKLYIIASAGAEGNGVKLFSASKITARIGIGLGYQFNDRLSVQTGFYSSSKKYNAQGGDYKTKPGTYWNNVNIKDIEANCKVYEIPVSIIYNFKTGKKLNLFASAGISSYIMKKENYHLYYERYGNYYHAETFYKGNKNLFSVLRLSAGVEKRLNKSFTITASPGIAIPLAGVGDGEVKLYSTDISIGIKFFPFHKN